MWFTNPGNLIKNPSSLVVVNSIDNGLNLLTLCCFVLSYIMKKNNNPMWKNFILFSILTIIFMGTVNSKSRKKEETVAITNEIKRELNKTLVV